MICKFSLVKITTFDEKEIGRESLCMLAPEVHCKGEENDKIACPFWKMDA
jgi:hypothetical protein